MTKKLYIETMGCAMNVRDSEHIIAELSAKKDYLLTDKVEEADLIVVNTCSVREKPVSKLFSEIGVFVKKRKPNAKIGVVGCTATHLGDEILKKSKNVDFVLGARNISKISTAVDTKSFIDVKNNHDESRFEFEEFRYSPYKASINISIGCDKSCTFCIVPYTRGSEVAIPADIIIKEAKRASQSGAKDILLLGQNVNNYSSELNGVKVDFTSLLKELSNIDTIEQIRFTSPHPLHFDERFLQEFANNPKLVKSIHMPLQSGSSKILKSMKRGYTKEWFLEKAYRLRELTPRVFITTDIIVGFPGEDDEDFEETIDVVNKVKFEQIFSFKYSKRPHTLAINFDKEVDDVVASKRITELIRLHQDMLDSITQKELGTFHDVYFDELKANGFVGGKSYFGFNIQAKGSEDLLGKVSKVKITSTNRQMLTGQICKN